MSFDSSTVAMQRLSRRGVISGLGAGVAALAFTNPRLAMAAAPPLKTVTPGALTIAINGDMPMTSVKDGVIIGADGEMIALIATKLGLKPVPALMDWSATIESVRGGRADVMLGNMGWTQPRSQVMALTDPIYYTGKFTLTRKDMKVGAKMSLDDYRGRTLGTVNGFTIVPELKKIPGAGEVKLYDTTDACVRDVRAGRCDFGFLDTPTVSYMVQQNPDWDLKMVPSQPYEGFKVLGQKQITLIGMNGDNLDLFDAVNAGIAWLWKSGANAKLLKKYGMESDDYLAGLPNDNNPRLGVDRDEKGAVIGKWAHAPKDFSTVFASAAL
ncbi:polar amino acid transport system substrate-binding protein [Bosea sp. BE271]|uniref:substrate-binding periplasmic protein n=1 Tax=Bosea TaxID=85413 RepID=UPI00285539B1|nr:MULTISPECIES: ABC transporter substrate-binding protein [Bosea]MDR6827666.1 polar amino acid transport system substrate-binding protein [Bosea robiniae]MDR6894640.1 polar amino acid transport system substrate-binding protein [Bosea sp. BE109]MDR7137772.1 polar amino acid transport system substrate-binding protein [Bosea sp. BE168]MDR7174471.1 polar amino acid transport system substrate-binding protein [Bosea sp. BE271]